MLELFAGQVEFVLLQRIVHMVLDLESSTHTLNDVRDERLAQSVKSTIDVTIRPREGHELRRVDDVAESRHFLQEPLEVEAALVNELKILVAESFFDGVLRRQEREWDTRPPELQFLAEFEKLVVASIALPHALGVATLAFVDNMPTAVLRMRAGETLLIRSLNKLVALVENVGIDFGLFAIFGVSRRGIDFTFLLFFFHRVKL